jgi:hypothetical protein
LCSTLAESEVELSSNFPLDEQGPIAELGAGTGRTATVDPFIAHLQRSEGWITTTCNNMSDPASFAAAGTEEQEGGELTPLAGAGVVVCVMT